MYEKMKTGFITETATLAREFLHTGMCVKCLITHTLVLARFLFKTLDKYV